MISLGQVDKPAFTYIGHRIAQGKLTLGLALSAVGWTALLLGQPWAIIRGMGLFYVGIVLESGSMLKVSPTSSHTNVDSDGYLFPSHTLTVGLLSFSNGISSNQFNHSAFPQGFRQHAPRAVICRRIHPPHLAAS